MTDRGPQSPREHLSALLSLVPRAIRAAWVGGIVLPIGLGLTIVWALSTPHLYRSETVIAYEHGVRSGALGTTEGDSPREVATRLREMLTSRQRLERVIKEMNLYHATVDRHSMAEAIDEMSKHVTLSGREGYTFRVSFDGTGRELAQRVLEQLVKGVIDDDAQRRVREVEETKGFLDAERKHADDDLKTKESALAGFLTKHPQLAAEVGGNGATMGGVIRAADRDRIPPAASGDVAALELQAAQLEEALVAAGSRPPVAPGLVAPGDPGLIAARDRAQVELQAAQKDLTEKQAHYTNEHPDVKAALSRLALAEVALRRAASTLEADRVAAGPAGTAGAVPPSPEDTSPVTSRTAALRHALAAVHSQIGALRSRGATRTELPVGPTSVVAIDTEWTRLNRDVSAAREQQGQLESKQFQAQLMATLVSGGQGGRLTVVDPAFRPMRPITGGRFKIALVGMGASVVLSLLTIVVFAAFDDRLYDSRDLHRLVKDGIVVVIPKLTGKSG
jgi:succinoglycan biosynthesis transport protein ExoP